MFKNVLNKAQENLIPLLELFSKDFYLAGGTAIALQLGHRKSIDFNLFSDKEINGNKIINLLKTKNFAIERVLANSPDELTVIISGVKITFLYYPFKIYLQEQFTINGGKSIIKMPDVKYLSAMKFYTIGRRGKWKDYVDIYTIINAGYSFSEISALAEQIYDGAYNEKLLREQLCYYDDINYSEEVEYIGEDIQQETIKNFLINLSIN